MNAFETIVVIVLVIMAIGQIYLSIAWFKNRRIVNKPKIQYVNKSSAEIREETRLLDESYGNHEQFQAFLTLAQSDLLDSISITSMKLEASRITVDVLVLLKDETGQVWSISCKESAGYCILSDAAKTVTLNNESLLSIGVSWIRGDNFAAKKLKNINFSE